MNLTNGFKTPELAFGIMLALTTKEQIRKDAVRKAMEWDEKAEKNFQETPPDGHEDILEFMEMQVLTNWWEDVSILAGADAGQWMKYRVEVRKRRSADARKHLVLETMKVLQG